MTKKDLIRALKNEGWRKNDETHWVRDYPPSNIEIPTGGKVVIIRINRGTLNLTAVYPLRDLFVENKVLRSTGHILSLPLYLEDQS